MTPRRLAIPEGPLLVVAPHPDDETLGCGGLISACVARGDRVHTIFVTDGGASHPNSRVWNRAMLARQREAEAAEALRRLGAGDEPRTFLRLPDAAMPKRDNSEYVAALGAIGAIIRDFRPGLVLLPWRRDPHCDHRDSWALATEALSATSLGRATLEYAIWLDELGGAEDRPAEGEMEPVFIDVPPATKRHALAAHLSQLGELVADDPEGFVLDPATIARLTCAQEFFWQPCRVG